MNEVNTSFVLEQFHRELLSAAQSARTIGELTWLAARITDEVAERFHGNAGIETEHQVEDQTTQAAGPLTGGQGLDQLLGLLQPDPCGV